MLALIISDIHANLIALETVLENAGSFDSVWCLGDVVGYGPNPNECVSLIRKQPNLKCLIGNHDAASLGLLDLTTFNPEAKKSIEWTISQLNDKSIEFLKMLPETETIGNVTLAHGSPRQPVYEYLIDTKGATENFNYFKTDYCFVGHTHLPTLFSLEKGDKVANLSIPTIDMKEILSPRNIINPGSVGQPRDRDSRSSYAIFDTEKNTWEYKRVSYDIAETQKRMKMVNLPARHISRLEGGW